MSSSSKKLGPFFGVHFKRAPYYIGHQKRDPSSENYPESPLVEHSFKVVVTGSIYDVQYLALHRL